MSIETSNEFTLVQCVCGKMPSYHTQYLGVFGCDPCKKFISSATGNIGLYEHWNAVINEEKNRSDDWFSFIYCKAYE
jgi:hypothetical protein